MKPWYRRRKRAAVDALGVLPSAVPDTDPRLARVAQIITSHLFDQSRRPRTERNAAVENLCLELRTALGRTGSEVVAPVRLRYAAPVVPGDIRPCGAVGCNCHVEAERALWQTVQRRRDELADICHRIHEALNLPAETSWADMPDHIRRLVSGRLENATLGPDGRTFTGGHFVADQAAPDTATKHLGGGS